MWRRMLEVPVASYTYSEVYGEAWIAPAKLAWEKLGRDQDGMDNQQSQEMVRFRKIPDDILSDPTVQAAIAAVSALRVSDGPVKKMESAHHGGGVSEQDPAAAATSLAGKATTPALALTDADALSATPVGANIIPGVGADASITPPLAVNGGAASPPYPPGFGPVALFNTKHAAVPSGAHSVAVMAAPDGGTVERTGPASAPTLAGPDRDMAEGMVINKTPPLPSPTGTEEGELNQKKELIMQVTEDDKTKSVLGKRAVQSVDSGGEDGTGWNEKKLDKNKKKKGLNGAGQSATEEKGGKEATGPGAAGELTGASASVRQEE